MQGTTSSTRLSRSIAAAAGAALLLLAAAPAASAEEPAKDARTMETAAARAKSLRLFARRARRGEASREAPAPLLPQPPTRADERLTAPLIMPIGRRPQPLLPRYS